MALDSERLAALPEGYARRGYLQAGLGYTIKPDMPTSSGPDLGALLTAAARWMAGARARVASFREPPGRSGLGAGEIEQQH